MVEKLEEFDPEGLIIDLSELKIEEEEEEENYECPPVVRKHHIKLRSRRLVPKDSSDSTSQKSNAESIVDTAKKIAKDKLKLLPYANILKVQSTFTDSNGNTKVFINSGALIGPRHILTAHYNIHQKELGNAISVEVISQVGNLTAKMISNFNFGINPTETDLKYYNNADLALLILDKTIGLTLGYLPMVAVKTIKPLQEHLHITGYSIRESGQANLWTNEGMCEDPKESLKIGIAEYKIRTDSQMIGSPIYVEITGQNKRISHYIIGIQSSQELKGILLIEERMNQIRNKITETK